MVDVKDLQAGVGVLPLLAIDEAADSQSGRVGLELVRRDDTRPDGCEAVQTLAEIPLLVGRLDIAGRDVVQDGVAEDDVLRLPGRHIFGIHAQHHSQLAFVVQLLHKVGVGLDEAAVRHRPRDPLGKVDGILMPGRKGVGGILFRLVRVGHVVDAQADDVLRRGRDGAFQRDGLNGQGRDARNGQRQSRPHLRGQERDGVGQRLIAQAQPAQRPDLTAICRQDGRVFDAVRQTAGDKAHGEASSQCR